MGRCNRNIPNSFPADARRIARSAGLAALACASLLLAPAAHAQQQEFKLGDDGSLVKTREIDPASDEGKMQRARQYLAENRTGLAYKLVNDWLERYERTDNPWIAEAYVIRGDAKTARGDEYDALYDYEEVIKGFPGTEQFATAVEREMDIGMRYLGGLKRRFLGMRIDDATGLGEELLLRCQERMPGSRLAERACIELADYYYRTRDLRMAAEAYSIFLKNYPNSQYRQKAMQRRVFSNIGRFKGPNYDASGLLESKLLIEDFTQSYPADAEAAGLNDALVARLDESAGAQMLESAKWYLTRHDPVSAKLMLRRLLRKHPDSVAAVRALEIIKENGWDAKDFQTAPPETEKAGPDAPKGDEAAGTEKPADAKPADAKPADPKPDGEKPAEAKPAEPKPAAQPPIAEPGKSPADQQPPIQPKENP